MVTQLTFEPNIEIDEIGTSVRAAARAAGAGDVIVVSALSKRAADVAQLFRASGLWSIEDSDQDGLAEVTATKLCVISPGAPAICGAPKAWRR